MDDSADVDLFDVSPISSPGCFQITGEPLWGTGEPHSDTEKEATGNGADNSNYRHGSPRWLPHGGLKPLTLETNLPPPFLYSPGYPSTVGNTPSPFSYTSDYFDLGSQNLLQPTKVNEDMRLHRCPHPLVYNLEDFDDAYAWDLHSCFPAFWDVGDDSDVSELSDESTDYITFTGQSSPTPPEPEQGFWKFGLSEPSPFALDFPEDVGESLEHDTVLVDGDFGTCMVDHLGGPASFPASEIPVGLSVQSHEDFATLSVYAPDIPLSRMRKLPGDNGELDSLPHLPYPELDVTDVPINVPVSPFVTDGFTNDTTSPYSGLLGVEVEEIPLGADWLGGPWGEMVWGTCGLEEGPVEWNLWRGQVFEELDRDLESWAEVRERVRRELDWF